MAKISGWSAVQRSDDLAGAVDAVDAAAMSGGGVERTIGRLGHAPDDGLIGGEEGIDFGREREAAFAAERDAVEAAADEIASTSSVSQVVVPLEKAAGGEQPRTERRHKRSDAWRESFLYFHLDGFGAGDHHIADIDLHFRDFGIAGLGDAGRAGLRAGQDQGDRSRRVGQIGAFELEGRVGAPDADVGLGVGMQIVDGGDQLAGRARAWR